MELQTLIEKTMPSEQRCSPSEYLFGEEEVAVSKDTFGDDCYFLAHLGG
jgi:hypothetical protein